MPLAIANGAVVGVQGTVATDRAVVRAVHADVLIVAGAAQQEPSTRVRILHIAAVAAEAAGGVVVCGFGGVAEHRGRNHPGGYVDNPGARPAR